MGSGLLRFGIGRHKGKFTEYVSQKDFLYKHINREFYFLKITGRDIDPGDLDNFGTERIHAGGENPSLENFHSMALIRKSDIGADFVFVSGPEMEYEDKLYQYDGEGYYPDPVTFFKIRRGANIVK